MKKIILAASALALGSVAAHAADGTITITGKVTDQTCTINGGTGDFTVALPTVSKSTLANSGDVAGLTPFTINLTACSAGDVATYFEVGSNVDINTGNLINTVSGGAANVQVQLVGSNNEAIEITAGSSGAQPNSQVVTVDQDGNADLNYYAQYFATGAATAGDVSTSVQYSIVYP